MTSSSPSAPTLRAAADSSIVSRVEFEPVPATTGTRFFAAWTTISMIRMCSSTVTVGDSPVVPTGTSPSMPAAICSSTSLRSASSSTASPRNGVTSAVMTPVNIAFL